MKLSLKLLSLMVLFLSSSCAMLFNDKEVEVRIGSSPAGADIFIEGRHYGKTPATLKIIPKNYIVTLAKQGYGSTQLKLESWAAVRTKQGEGGRCLADALGTMLILPYYSFYFSGKCDEFKKNEYFATIPYLGVGAGMIGAKSDSLMGMGQDPANMVNYYYGRDGISNTHPRGQAR